VKRVPGAISVDRALASALREVAKSRNSLNKQAGLLLGRGKYDDAEALVRAGRNIDSFQLRLDSLKREWKSIRTLGDEAGTNSERTPLWRAYIPILRALIELGGSASRSELVDFLNSSDLVAKSESKNSATLDWKRVLGRARRPLVDEGFLHANTSIWRITDVGRQAVRDQG
jgi:hypothetical protein